VCSGGLEIELVDIPVLSALRLFEIEDNRFAQDHPVDGAADAGESMRPIISRA
jgi:hypothetical protein